MRKVPTICLFVGLRSTVNMQLVAALCRYNKEIKLSLKVVIRDLNIKPTQIKIATVR